MMTAWRCHSPFRARRVKPTLPSRTSWSVGVAMYCARNAEQARKDAETRTALLAGLERKLAQGDKALVGNAGYRRFLADPAGRVHHRCGQSRGRCAFRWAVRVAHQYQADCPASGAALPQFAGRGTGLSRRQDVAGDTTNLPPHRCCHPRPHLLHVPRLGAAQGTDGPAASPAATPCQNGNRSSTISPTSARSRSSRTGAGRCCAPPQGPSSTRFAGPSA